MAALSEDGIFDVARQISSLVARDAYLDQACNGNCDLRARVDELLAADAAADTRLDSPLVPPTVDHAGPVCIEQQGDYIGPYKLRERLGEGGMGVVWAAEQKQPLRRRAALKVIKPGMDSSQVVARFEAERETLALMEHPNIARVLDAGTTDQGRPYFVMELIRGVPITEYCDTKALTIRGRLELFAHVCRAIQHAHQKGVIHRDIKPTNVLVSEQDGQPIPKVIDFGVAKALHQPLADRSVYTGVFQAIGTLAYMSPEQAGLSIADVDTRADVYGLGVLLYELLTGLTPFDKDALASAALGEACRIICEEDPPKPSVRLSTLGDLAAMVSAGRGTDLAGLSRQVSGDLDWVVVKSLEKDRSRRYESANDLAAEVERYLQNEPVEACPPSIRYRIRKFASRNRALIGAGSVVALALLLATIISFGFAIKAKRALKVSVAVEDQLDSTLNGLRQMIVDKAIQSVLVGDTWGVSEALEMGVKAGVRQELIDLIRACRNLYSDEGKQDLAFSEMQRLLAQNDSITVRGLYINALLWSGKGSLDQHYEQVNVIRDLDPKSDLERILKAQALVVVAPDAAVRLLRDCRDSPLVSGLLAQSLNHIAADVGDMERALEAHKRINAARQFLPNSSMLRSIHVCVCRTLCRLAEDGDRAAYFDEGYEVIREAGANATPVELLAHSWLYRLAEDEESLAALDKQLLDEKIWIGNAIPRQLLRLGFANTLAEVNTRSLGSSAISKGGRAPLALLRSLNHDSKALVLKGVGEADLTSRALFVIDNRVGLLAATILSGGRRHSQVSRIVDELRRCDLPDFRRPKKFWDFILGDVDESVFIDSNRGSAGRAAVAQFFAGITTMVDGDRQAAIRHFRECVAYGPYSTGYYEWARVILALLKANDPLLNWVGTTAKQ